MAIGIAMLILSFMYLMLTSIVYFSKKRVDNLENRIYETMLSIGFLGIILEIGCIFSTMFEQTSWYPNLIVRFFLIYIITWMLMFTKYTTIISIYALEKEKKYSRSIVKKITYLIYIIVCILVILLPLEYVKKDGYAYVEGLSTVILYMALVIYTLFCVVCVIIKRKAIKMKKKLPLYLFILFIIVMLFIRNYNPSLPVVTTIYVFVTILMYFTIENPDVKMINQLELAKDKADKANNAKTDFLSNMSHEIRTPLNAIVGFSECIENAKDLEDAKQDAKDIVMASQNLLELVNGILDISKIEADKMEIVNSEYHLKDILNNLVKLIEPRIKEKPIELKTNFAVDLPDTLYGDSGKVKQIITNILTNAAKYTDAGEINFSVSCINHSTYSDLVISVNDTGRGIKKDKIEELFTKFQRLDQDRNTTIEGTGLGLAITKRLVEMMGGKIVVHSIYGKGSNFTIYLRQEIRNTVCKKKEEVVYSKEKFPNSNVLVVDDNKLNLKVATKLLKEYELNIECVESGFECLNKVKDNNYDIIFMDIMMPKMGGVETFKKLKEMDNFKIPVVALTADAISGKAEKYLEVGFDAYISKPIDRIELNNVINRMLKGDKK